MNQLYFPVLQETTNIDLENYMVINNPANGKPMKIKMEEFLSFIQSIITPNYSLTTRTIPYFDGTNLVDSYLSQDTNGIILQTGKIITDSLGFSSLIFGNNNNPFFFGMNYGLGGHGGFISGDTTNLEVVHTDELKLQAPLITIVNNVIGSGVYGKSVINFGAGGDNYIYTTDGGAGIEAGQSIFSNEWKGYTQDGFLRIRTSGILINHSNYIQLDAPEIQISQNLITSNTPNKAWISFGSGNNIRITTDGSNESETGLILTPSSTSLYTIDGAYFVDNSRTLIQHSTKIELDCSIINFNQLTANRMIYLNSSKNLVVTSMVGDGNNIFFTNGYGIDVVGTGGSDILNIGATNADIINIGNSSSVVNILGTRINEYAVNGYTVDKLMTFNWGGSAGSAIGSGFEIEENNIITGYFKTNAARNGFSILAPAISYYGDLNFNLLSANRAYSLPNTSGTLALTSDLSSYVPTSRTLTINGTTYDLSSDRNWTIVTSSSPLTTKGDLYTYGTGNVALAVGSNASMLIADSTATNGIKWVSWSGDVTITTSGATTIKNDVALGGNPTTTTQASNDNSTKIATTAFVTTAVAAANPAGSKLYLYYNFT